MDLSILGYTRDEMKHLTPKECWKITEVFPKNHLGNEVETNNQSNKEITWEYLKIKRVKWNKKVP